MKIIFFGTPVFAAEILEYLLDNKIDVLAVVTQPDKTNKNRVHIPAIKKIAEKFPEIDIYQPEKASDPDFIQSLKKYKADLFVVVAYGQILKQELLDIPKLDCINIHASLLPKYRGANPIRRAIEKGEDTTGVTIMKMVKKMDAGDMIRTKEVEISDNMDFGALEEKLIEISKPLLLEVIKDYEKDRVQFTTQDESGVTFAKKYTYEEMQLDWNKDAKDNFNLIRALSPKPGAFIKILINDQTKILKILKTKISDNFLPPKKIDIQKDALFIGCKDRSLKILEVQLEGKKRMKAADFIRGIKNQFLIVD